MKNVFKSKYYFRIIDKIAELEDEITTLKEYRDDLKQSLNPKEWSHYAVQIADKNMMIRTLKAML